MIKIDKDIYVRDEYGVRWQLFAKGTEVDEFKYNEAFRLNVPVNPEDLPVKPEFIGQEYTHGRILEDNKELFVEPAEDKSAEKEDKTEGDKVVEAIKEAEAEKEAEEAPKTKKKGK